MAGRDDETNPGAQLVDLLVYLPIGLLYEYQEVVPKLVKRGRSQVQLARVIGQMAVNRGQSDPSAAAGDLVNVASAVVARAITEIGSQIGLAPPGRPANGSAPTDPEAAPTTPPAASTSSAAPERADGGADADRGPLAAPAGSANGVGGDREGAETEARPVPLPIARYDELTAREIIPLLEDLSPTQRARIRTHEAGNRNRKTVLAKLDRLDG